MAFSLYRYWKQMSEFVGTHCHGLDAETIPIFLDWLRDHGRDDYADEIESCPETRASLIDPTIPDIAELAAKFPGAKQIGFNRFAYVEFQLMGAGRICAGPMNCTFGFDDWYQYRSVAQAMDALEQWSGNGLPLADGMTRRSGPNQSIIRMASPGLLDCTDDVAAVAADSVAAG